MNENMVSIIIPAKDEPYLPTLVDNLKLTIQNLLVSREIIVITSDRSKTSPPQLPEDVKIFKSYGDSLERAILLGFSVAQGKKIIIMDADGSHSPETVPKIIKELETREMVVASRFVEGSIFDTSIFRFFITFIFNGYAKLLGSTLSDPMSGFFGIHSSMLEKIKFRPYKWKIALEIHNKLRPSTKEIPYAFRAYTEGKSKFSNWRIGLKLLWDITVSAL